MKKTNTLVFLALAVFWAGSATARPDHAPENKVIVLSTTKTSDASAQAYITSDEPALAYITSDEPASAYITSDEPASASITSDEPALASITSDEPASASITSDEPASASITIDGPASASITSDEQAPAATTRDASAPAYITVNPSTSALPITIETVELSDKKDKKKVVTWLGLAVEESSEALSSQLGLKTGEGLTVSMIAADSPAAKAEFHTNDVLVEMDGQMLVHPMQLRKLVQMHAEGDPVSLKFYRGGKKQTIAVKLGKTTWAESAETTNPAFPGFQQNFQFGLKDPDIQLRRLSGVGQSLAWAGLDKSKMNTDIKRTMEQTRKAIQDALQHATSDQKSLAGVDKELEALTRDGVDVDKDATVIIRNKHNSSKTIVQTDDSGSYIIEQGAKTHLTARGKDGKLLFEGEIDTAAEREKVPKEVWEKVAPMFDQITAPDGLKPKAERRLKDRFELLKQKV